MDIATLTAVHPLPDGQLTLLGAVETVTGSMTRVEMAGARILVDCGVAQGREAERWQLPDEAQAVDAIVLTHGHNDHVGSLPAVLERGFEGTIFGTQATLDIAELVLCDGIGIEGGSDEDIARFRKRFRAQGRAIAQETAFSVPGFRGELFFREAGHILGSSSVELIGDKSRVICSGDLGRPKSPLLRDFNEHWRADRPLDAAIVESTYGDCNHEHTHEDVEKALERIINRAVRDGGHILVPAFAIGRTQTLIYHLNTLIEAGRIPNLPVAIDSPLGLRVTELHNASVRLFDHEAQQKLARGDDPLSFESLYAVRRGKDSARLRDAGEPMLIIAGSGMCTGGRIVGHLIDLLPREETCVVFVGFQAPGTAGRAIQDAARRGGSVQLKGQYVPVRAQVETLSGLSAHADQRELIRWVRALPDPRRLVLNHGEPEAQAALAKALARAT
jgi:metallo-beta-lactamase family protein